MKDLFPTPPRTEEQLRRERRQKRWRRLRQAPPQEVQEVLSNWFRAVPEMKQDLAEFVFLAAKALRLYTTLVEVILDDHKTSECIRRAAETVLALDELTAAIPDSLYTHVHRARKRLDTLLAVERIMRAASPGPAEAGRN
jgi:hypothetical protein